MKERIWIEEERKVIMIWNINKFEGFKKDIEIEIVLKWIKIVEEEEMKREDKNMREGIEKGEILNLREKLRSWRGIDLIEIGKI